MNFLHLLFLYFFLNLLIFTTFYLHLPILTDLTAFTISYCIEIIILQSAENLPVVKNFCCKLTAVKLEKSVKNHESLMEIL
jgi:hypothetical protein